MIIVETNISVESAMCSKEEVPYVETVSKCHVFPGETDFEITVVSGVNGSLAISPCALAVEVDVAMVPIPGSEGGPIHGVRALVDFSFEGREMSFLLE